ncbi:hypothetical protein DRO55_00525 [Candidatus Bathyarchaeota archaeon]|nr:MAG: hypothetical protein DRO55_00525 [Candidatus Bathyarchaeota archaeon]
MKIGCGTVNFRKYSLQEALKRISKAGYKYVEPQATAPFCPHVNVYKNDPNEFRRLIESYGFKGATGLWSQHGALLTDEQSVPDIKKTIKWAHEAEIPIVICGDGKKPEYMSDEKAFKVLEEKLSDILEVAEKYGVYLAIEPHGTFSLTAEGLKRIMSLCPSKWLGINYDTANVHRASYVETVRGAYSWRIFGRKQDEVATLTEVVDKVIHVHVKDVVKDKCVALGRGEVNIIGCLKVLKEHNYDGVLSLETEGEYPADEAQRLIEESRNYLIKALKKLNVQINS